MGAHPCAEPAELGEPVYPVRDAHVRHADLPDELQPVSVRVSVRGSVGVTDLKSSEPSSLTKLLNSNK